MTPLQPVMTSAGLAAVFASDDTGLTAKLTHVSFGDGLNGQGYTPLATQNSLHGPQTTIPIGGGQRVTPTEIEVQYLLDEGAGFWIREIGFIIDGESDAQGEYVPGTGTLLAVWSDPDTPLAYKTVGVPLAGAYYLALSAIPPGSVELVVSGPSVNLTIIGPFAQMSAEIIRLQRRAVESEIARLIPEIQSKWR